VAPGDGMRVVWAARVPPCALLGAPVFFFQAEDGIRARTVTGVQTCALPMTSGRQKWKGPEKGPGPFYGGRGRAGTAPPVLMWHLMRQAVLPSEWSRSGGRGGRGGARGLRGHGNRRGFGPTQARHLAAASSTVETNRSASSGAVS